MTQKEKEEQEKVKQTTQQPTVKVGTQLTTQPKGEPTPSQSHHDPSEKKEHKESIPAQLTKEGQLAVPPDKENKVPIPPSSSTKTYGQKANALAKLDEFALAIRAFERKEGYDVGPAKKTLERLKKDLESSDINVVNAAIDEAIGLKLEEGFFKEVTEVSTVNKK